MGLSFDSVESAFRVYGAVKGVCPADDSGSPVVVSFCDEKSAVAVFEALNRHPCAGLGGRCLHICYSVCEPRLKVQLSDLVQVSLEASHTNIPGIYLIRDFVSAKEEEELLAAVDARPWHSLAKRRVQHYGYEFCYETRNVDTDHYLGELPLFVSPVLDRVPLFKKLDDAADTSLDQLTVNECPPGVGLTLHIDTHSAFVGSIFSLSLAGPCIVELRKYIKG